MLLTRVHFLLTCLQQEKLMSEVSVALDKTQQMSKSAEDLGSAKATGLMKDLPEKQEKLRQVNKELASVKSKISSFADGENVESLSRVDFLKLFIKRKPGMSTQLLNMVDNITND